MSSKKGSTWQCKVTSSSVLPLHKLAHAIYRDFLTVKIENFIGKKLVFLTFLLKTYIVGYVRTASGGGSNEYPQYMF